MSIVPKRARTLDTTGGSAKHPATWGLPLKFSFPANKHWATTLKLNVDPIDLFEYAGNHRTVMKIMSGTYILAASDVAGEIYVMLLTTSLFDVNENDGVSPIQVDSDSDTIFRGSAKNGQDDAGLNKDMEILPDGSTIVVVTPTIYAYLWRGTNFNPTDPLASPYGQGAADVYCSIKLAYYMTTLGPNEKLDKYIASTQNASFLEFIPAV